MNRITFFALVCTVGVISSCEYTYTYTYIVTNQCDTTISIHLKTYSTDTVYSLDKGVKKTIYITDHGIESSKGPYYKSVDEDLDQFTVVKDQINSKRDFLNGDSWSFEKGDYTTTVKNDDF